MKLIIIEKVRLVLSFSFTTRVRDKENAKRYSVGTRVRTLRTSKLLSTTTYSYVLGALKDPTLTREDKESFHHLSLISLIIHFLSFCP